MIKEYWIDRGYIRNYNCITYGAEETYTNYQEFYIFVLCCHGFSMFPCL